MEAEDVYGVKPYLNISAIGGAMAGPSIRAKSVAESSPSFHTKGRGEGIEEPNEFMKDDETKLMGSLMGFAMRTAKELQAEVPSRYGLDFEDYKAEVLLACFHLGREWRPRTPSEGHMDEDETSMRTYCWRLAKVRAKSQIERKYGKNLRHLRMSFSNDFKDGDGASAIDAISFDDDARSDAEKMVEEIRSISNPFEVKIIDLLMNGKTHREIALEMGLKYH